MIAYRYDENKYYTGTQTCQLDPVASRRVNKEVYLLPADCTYDKPLEAKEGYNVKFNGTWEYEEIPVEETPQSEAHELTTDEKLAQLDAQYSTDKSELQKYYLDAMINGDEDSMAEIKAELDELASQYEEDYNALAEEA